MEPASNFLKKSAFFGSFRDRLGTLLKVNGHDLGTAHDEPASPPSFWVHVSANTTSLTAVGAGIGASIIAHIYQLHESWRSTSR